MTKVSLYFKIKIIDDLRGIVYRLENEKWGSRGFRNTVALEKLLERMKAKRRFLLRRKAGITSDKNFNIEDIKSIPIKKILETFNIKVEGKRFMIRKENTPSAFIYEKTNSWCDFGSGEGGSNIDLYIKLTGCDTKTAIKELKNML